jgi:hypothetical protein
MKRRFRPLRLDGDNQDRGQLVEPSHAVGVRNTQSWKAGLQLCCSWIQVKGQDVRGLNALMDPTTNERSSHAAAT